MLYFFMVAHKSACQTLSKAFLRSMKTCYRSQWCWRYFSQRIHRLKICFMVLLPALKPACSSVMIFSACGFNLFSMILHDFAWVADEADRWVVLALLQVAFLGKCDDQQLDQQGLPFSCLPDLVADCCESGDYILSTCLDQFCWDVVDSS